jgi:hypothetical protein
MARTQPDSRGSAPSLLESGLYSEKSDEIITHFHLIVFIEIPSVA